MEFLEFFVQQQNSLYQLHIFTVNEKVSKVTKTFQEIGMPKIFQVAATQVKVGILARLYTENDYNFSATNCNKFDSNRKVIPLKFKIKICLTD